MLRPWSPSLTEIVWCMYSHFQYILLIYTIVHHIRGWKKFEVGFSRDSVPFWVQSSRGWVPVGVESSRGWVPFGVESSRGSVHSEFSPIRGSVPFGVGSIWGSVPFGVQSIRGWVPFGVGSIRVSVHSRFSPFEVQSIRGWVFLGSVCLGSVVLGSVGESYTLSVNFGQNQNNDSGFRSKWCLVYAVLIHLYLIYFYDVI
jgi:hypothetical protein